MSEYKGIKITRENEDKLCDQMIEDSEKEFKLLCESLSIMIGTYKESYYLIDTVVKLLEVVCTYQQDVSIYETRYMLDAIKALIININSNTKYISMDDLLNRVVRMREILDTPLPEFEDEENKD